MENVIYNNVQLKVNAIYHYLNAVFDYTATTLPTPQRLPLLSLWETAIAEQISWAYWAKAQAEESLPTSITR